MNNKKLLVTFFLMVSFILGCIVGGSFVYMRELPPMAEVAALADLTRTGNEAYVKYRYGSYLAAKTAMLRYIDQIEGFRGTKIGSSIANKDLGLAYGRLALAAEREGNATDFDQYLKLARELFSDGGSLVDESKIRGAVEHLDELWDQRLKE